MKSALRINRNEYDLDHITIEITTLLTSLLEGDIDVFSVEQYPKEQSQKS